MIERAAVVLEKFSRCRVLVVGDLMVDRYIRGTASRISPEAPVPVLLSSSENDELGGAANVARNISALGAECHVAGFAGNDQPGRELVRLCEAAGVDASAIVLRTHGPTTLKTRVLAGDQQLLRIDHEVTHEPIAEDLVALSQAVENKMRSHAFDAVIVSDYAKGVVQPDFVASISKLASEYEIPLYVDPKGTDFQKYRGAAIIKPNRSEMIELAQRWGWSITDPIAAAEMLRVEAGLQHVVLTLGDKGLAVVSEGAVKHISARAQEVFDVTGAGDTVMATLVLGLASGLEPETAAEFANHAAAIVIGKIGSATVSSTELAQSLASSSSEGLGRKVYGLAALTAMVERWRAEGKVVVFTNGCFDVLHAGHTGLLQDARGLGDRLVVGLNSDASITRLKGPGRPVTALTERSAVLGSLEAVDAIVVYEEDTPLQVIESLLPQIIVKGGDYDRSTVVGADIVESNGGRVEIVPITIPVSTTKIAQALMKL